MFVPKASAATITVTTTADEDGNPGPGTGCSLFEAVTAANTDAAYGGCTAGSGSDTINVPAGLYNLPVNGLPLVTGPLTVLGDTAGGTIIERAYFGMTITIDNQAYVFRDLTLRRSFGDGFNLNAQNANDYSITIDRVTLENNDAYAVSHNNDINSSGEVHITNSLIQNNIAALYNNECGTVGTMYVSNSIIRGHESPGVENACGHVVLNEVTINDNYNYDTEGGGVRSSGTTDMTNVTLFNNSSDTAGGGVAVMSGDATLTNVTIAGNHAPVDGGIMTNATNPLIYNTLVANNDANQCTTGIELVAGSTNNLATDDSCSDFPDNNFAVTADAKLAAALADNGGQAPIGPGGTEGNVLTLALLEGSPAIGAGSNDFCPAVDERDAGRPFGATCDIGAYEARYTSPTPSDPGATTSSAANTLADTGQNSALIAAASVVLLTAAAIAGRYTLSKARRV